jgi:hypothetical protein
MKNALTTIALTAVVLMTGCAANKEDRPPLLGTFPADGATRRVSTIAAAQAAIGAREDGILYAWHFDGKDLSPLGREKLDQIAEADTLANLNIYLDVKADTFGDRQKSVNAYLQDKGMAASHVVVIEGLDNTPLTPAAPGIAGLAKTDTGTSQGEGTEGAGMSSDSQVSTK